MPKQLGDYVGIGLVRSATRRGYAHDSPMTDLRNNLLTSMQLSLGLCETERLRWRILDPLHASLFGPGGAPYAF